MEWEAAWKHRPEAPRQRPWASQAGKMFVSLLQRAVNHTRREGCSQYEYESEGVSEAASHPMQ